MKKTASFLAAIALLNCSFLAHALPKTVIERVYYKTPDKLEIVGYYYQGCMIGSRVAWGVKTPYVESDSLLPPEDCTLVGETRPDKWGQCMLEKIWAGRDYFQAVGSCI